METIWKNKLKPKDSTSVFILKTFKDIFMSPTLTLSVQLSFQSVQEFELWIYLLNRFCRPNHTNFTYIYSSCWINLFLIFVLFIKEHWWFLNRGCYHAGRLCDPDWAICGFQINWNPGIQNTDNSSHRLPNINCSMKVFTMMHILYYRYYNLVYCNIRYSIVYNAKIMSRPTYLLSVKYTSTQ